MRYEAPRSLHHGDIQTLLGALPAPDPSRQDTRRELQRVPVDGGALALHADFQSAPADALLLVHGLGGSAQATYMRRAAGAALRSGLHAARLDLRGAGDSVGLRPGMYHAGLWRDLLAVLEHLAADTRVQRVALMGFSLGGHVSLKLLGEADALLPPALVGAVSISAPLDLARSCVGLHRPRALAYRGWVLLHLGLDARRARSGGRTLYRRLDRFDDAVIAPMHGFAGVEDYYARASAAPVLGRIRRPVLVLHAQDDPMVLYDDIVGPLRAANNPALSSELTRTGGHVAFVEGFGRRGINPGYAVRRGLAFTHGLLAKGTPP